MNKRQKQKHMKPNCLRALADLPVVAVIARRHGVSIRYTQPQSSPHCRPTLHVMFDEMRTGKRVVDWWPGSWRWRTRAGDTGLENSAIEVLVVAVCTLLGKVTLLEQEVVREAILERERRDGNPTPFLAPYGKDKATDVGSN